MAIIERINTFPNGAEANRPGGTNWFDRYGGFSPDNTKVIFHAAPNFASDHWNVIIKDRITGGLSAVDTLANGQAAIASTTGAGSWSVDGTKIVFFSDARNIPDSATGTFANTNQTDSIPDWWHIYVKTLSTGLFQRVTPDNANGSSDIPYFSADGTKVVYTSAASNIVAGDTNQKWDVFVRDLATSTTTRISVADNEAQSAHHAFEPAVVGYNPALHGSSWGTFHPTDSNLVMFMSSGNNLVAGDTNAAPFAPGIGEWGFDVFIRNISAGTTTRVSLSDDDQQLLGSSGPGFWSPDGTKVLFNNPTGAGIYGQQLLIRDLTPGTTTIVSTTAAGVRVGGEAAAWSNDGRSVTFTTGNQIWVKDVSGARVLANPDGIANNGDEYFYYPGELTQVSVSEAGTPGNVFSQGSLFNTTDTRVMFRSEATNLLPNGGDSNGISDVYSRLIPGTAQVTGVTSNTADGTYGIGAVIDVRVTFSAPVTVTGGTPTITLETGVTDVVVNLTGGSGTNTLSGSFTVVAGHNSSDLDYLHFLSLRENGSSIVDANGRPVDLEMSVPGAVGSLGNAKNIVIETSPPILEAVTSTTANGFYKAGEAINITLQFSEAVTLVGTLNVTLNTGDVIAFSNQSGTSLSATYTPQSGDNTADLTNTAIALAGGATLRDAASNNADLTMATSLGANKDIAIDTTVPTITSVTSTTANGTYGIGASINITVNFSEMVTLTGGSLQVTLDTGDVITFTQPIVNVSTVSATYVVSAGDNTLDLDTTSIAIVGGSSPVLQDRARNAIVNFTPGTDLAVNKDIVILTTPPDPPVITGVTEDRGALADDEVTSDANLFIDGTSGANATIQVTRVGVGVIGTTQADGDGNWSFDYTATTLGDGQHQFTAIVDSGLDSGPSNTLTVTIDTQLAVSAPDLAAASDSGDSDTDDITNDATPTFAGTADADATVEIVEVTDPFNPVVLGTATLVGGNWTFTPTTPLADGPYQIAARATDLAGNEVTSSALAVTIDTAVNISPPDLLPGSDNGASNTDNVTNVTSPSIQVTGDDGDVVELREGMAVLGTATISGGVANFNPTLAHGDHTLTAHGTDVAGNTVDTAALMLTIDTIPPAVSVPDLHPDSDSGTSSTDNLTNDLTPTFTGTGEVGATVQLLGSFSTVLGTTVVGGDGTWSITSANLGDEGPFFIRARATDLAGNVTTSDPIRIDIDFDTFVSVPDLTAATDTGVLDDDDLTNADPLVFTGSAERDIPFLGQSRQIVVTLYDTTGGGEVALGSDTVTTADGGAWSISVAGLAEGTRDIVARVEERLFGNENTSSALTVTVDRTVTVTGPDLAATSDSGRSDTDDITNDTTPELTGTGEEGAIVTLMEGANVLGTTTITGGVWSITTGTLADGDHDLFARVLDRAGNMRDTEPLTVTIDTIDPPVSVPDMTAATDLGASSVDNHTADPTPDFAGTSETDAIVELIVDGTPSGVTTLAAPGGAWMLTAPALSEGIHQISARATDVAGNVSDPSGALQVSIDLTPPETQIDAGPPPESNDNTPTFDFFSPDPEATFQASIDGGPFQPVGDPHTFPPIPDGDHVLRARAVDRAGNVDPTPAEWRWFHDATPPLPPVITRFADDSAPVGDRVTTDRTLEIFGTAEPNSQLRLMEAGLGLVGTVTVDGAGNWRIGPTGMLDEGVYTFIATASDRVGNVSDPSLPFVVIVDEPGNPTPLPDLLVGNDQANQIQGLDGNDTIFGFGGNDTVRGNNGNDSLLGGSGRDKLEGENGDDALLGEADNNSLYGGNGRDRADGGAGNDRIEAGAGNDELIGGDGADTMFGGTGADTLTGGAGADRLSGDAEGDLLLLGDDGARDSVAGTIAHLSGDTIDGFVGGAPTHAGADVLLIQGLSLANAKKLDGDLLVGGVLSLAEVGGGEITFDNLLNPGAMRLDTALGASGEVLIYIV